MRGHRLAACAGRGGVGKPRAALLAGARPPSRSPCPYSDPLTSHRRDHMLVTMKASRRMGAGEFKSKCLAVLDEVETSKREVVITKRGRPVARLVPLEPAAKEALAGLIVYEGDIVSPLDVAWDAAK